MKVHLKPEFELTNQACIAATGQTVDHWIVELEAHRADFSGRREAIQWLHEPCRKHLWWPTTLWVEYESRHGILQKDGKPEGFHICSTKTISAPLTAVYAAFDLAGLVPWFTPSTTPGGDAEGNSIELVRARENKDIRWKWYTAGVAEPTEVEIQLSEKAGKVGLIVNHKRIPNRAEADGLRAAWAVALNALKAQLEGKA